MPNITIEDYKKAIKKRYDEVKEGDNRRFLEKPSQANLRKLCWDIFLVNKKSDDLNTFSTVFEFCFDISKKNALQDKTDRFKAIGRFYKGITEKPTEEIIEFAAILVDFELRPFGKFKKYYQEEMTEDELIEDLKKTEALPIKEEKDLKEESSEGNFDKIESSTNDEPLKEETPNPVNLFVDFKNEKQEKEPHKISPLTLGSIITVTLLLVVCYYYAQKKECMQWSGDHYDEVSCDLEIQGIGTYNTPKPYDQRIINLRRIKVCDTTTFFKNEEAVVWYAKTANGIDFFNTHGMHPETGRALRPITPYIIARYVKKH